MVQTRRERLREATYEEIKSVAQKQMREQGAVALSLRGIATEMGLTAPALYRYFNSRDELVTALIVDAYNSLADALSVANATKAHEDYGGRFLAISLAFRQWALEHPQDFSLIYGNPIPGYHAPEEITTPAAWRSNSQFLQLLNDAWREGKITIPPEYTGLASSFYTRLEEWAGSRGLTIPATLMQIALTGWGQIQGMVSLELNGQFDYLEHDISDMYYNEIVAYLKRLSLIIET